MAKDDYVERIKNAGQCEALSREINNQLWMAKGELENATKENRRNFDRSMTSAIFHMDRARTLNQELETIQSAKA